MDIETHVREDLISKAKTSGEFARLEQTLREEYDCACALLSWYKNKNRVEYMPTYERDEYHFILEVWTKVCITAIRKLDAITFLKIVRSGVGITHEMLVQFLLEAQKSVNKFSVPSMAIMAYTMAMLEPMPEANACMTTILKILEVQTI